jgi:hypothetical protein
MKELHYKELISGKEYTIEHKELNTTTIYKGIFYEQYQRYFEFNPTIRFLHVTSKQFSYTNYQDFRENDKFYEIE